MREKLKKWLDLILFMGKPEDSSAGHVCHDYKEGHRLSIRGGQEWLRYCS